MAIEGANYRSGTKTKLSDQSLPEVLVTLKAEARRFVEFMS